MKLPNNEQFLQKMRQVGERNYYDRHPFHLRLNSGDLSIEAIRCWIRNRFHYQRNIPVKDAFILASAPRAVRQIWIHRITDHDGDLTTGQRGGILAWVRLDLGVSGEAPPDFGKRSPAEQDAILQEHEAKLIDIKALPGVRSAVAKYVTYAQKARWELAVASSLTEMFAPDLMIRRLAALEKNYPQIPAWAYDYFRNRPPQARRDCGEAWSLVVQHCATPKAQRQAVEALQFKCGILWDMLDAIMAATSPRIARKASRTTVFPRGHERDRRDVGGDSN